MSQSFKPKIFTIQEANALLPELNLRMDRLLHKKEAHARHHDVLFMQQMLEQAEGHPVEENLPQDLEMEIQWMESNIAALEADIHAIGEMGCILRSIEKGFVDFLSRRGSEYIYLCWKRGETSVQFYHSVQKGVCKRVPLSPV